MIRRDDLRALGALFGQFGKSHRLAIAGLSVVSTLAAAVTAIQPLLLAPALDAALVSGTAPARSIGELTLNNLGPTLMALVGVHSGQDRFHVVVVAASLYVGAVVLGSSLSFVALQSMRWIRTAVANDLQSALYRHMLSLSMPFFVAQRAGELANRFIYDVVATATAFDPLMKAVFESALQILLYGWVLFRTDAGLAVAVAAVAMLHLLITRVLQAQIRRRTADSFDAYGQIGSFVQETLVGIRVVKSFSAEDFEQRRLERILERLQGIVLRFGFYANSEQPLREIANALAVVTALLVAFQALSAGRLTLSGLVLFVVITRQAIGPFAQLSTAFVQLQGMIGASQRVREILAIRPTLIDGSRSVPALERGIEISGVSFTHESGGEVLSQIDLEIPKGSVVALVGPSGSGKSTLADLVLRLHDPSRGAIRWDGVDIREFRQADYRRHFGVVSQEALLFNASIEENVAYGRAIVADDVERAVRLANAEQFILEMPDGYRTLVGERGTRLSGGQRQRIAIARAVYGRPEVLILDEATSALDSESERQVQEAIDRTLDGATGLVIAHRLSTVRRAHKIVVLDQGRIEAFGTHDELLRKSALYQHLHELQFRGGPEPGAS